MLVEPDIMFTGKGKPIFIFLERPTNRYKTAQTRKINQIYPKKGNIFVVVKDSQKLYTMCPKQFGTLKVILNPLNTLSFLKSLKFLTKFKNFFL